LFSKKSLLANNEHEKLKQNIVITMQVK